MLPFFTLPLGPSTDGSDGWRTSDGSSAHDVQPACPQTHQPLRTHAWSSGDAPQTRLAFDHSLYTLMSVRQETRKCQVERRTGDRFVRLHEEHRGLITLWYHNGRIQWFIWCCLTPQPWYCDTCHMAQYTARTAGQPKDIISLSFE